MSEQAFAQPLQSDRSYLPNPRAARILSQAIQYGHAPDPVKLS